MTTPRVLSVALLALTVGAPPASAQRGPLWRSVDLARQLRDTQPERIRVQYDAGKVGVRAAAEPLLYQMHLRYDEARSMPLHRYDAEQRTTLLGLEPRAGATRASGDRKESGELQVALPRAIPLDLDLELDGTLTTLDLGGMALRSLRLLCGATDATLSFSAPNRVRMRDLDISVGAADLTATQLANANADQIRVIGGIGVMDLDFSGNWTRDVALSTELAMGKLVLRVPSDVGVRLTAKRIAAGVDGVERDGFVKRDDAWYSANWEQATHHLRVAAKIVVGKIDVQRISR